MSERKRIEVEIISKQWVKPAVPAPDHLRFYKVSHFDEYTQRYYMTTMYYYLNPSPKKPSSEMILERRQHLKKSLSETLTLFYPLAGKVYHDYIDCNNDGVYYVEAQVATSLSSFLDNLDFKSMHKLLPFIPSSKELLSQRSMVMIQVTDFGCGGNVIGFYTSHKIIDGLSQGLFMKAWAATTRGFPRSIVPSFDSRFIFPSDPNQKVKPIEESHPFFSQTAKTVTRRVVFSASSLKRLKTKTGSSRVVSVTCLIWKCFMAAKLRLDSRRPKPNTLAFILDLRPRCSPPLAPHLFGNILWPALVKYEAYDGVGELGPITELLKTAIGKVTSEFIDTLKGERGAEHAQRYLKEAEELFGGNYNDSMSISSLCNGRIYETDFGWGEPIWVSVGDASADVPMLENLVLLYDTKSGDGIEAWVTLTEEDMAIFQSHPELVAMATFDPSPFRMAFPMVDHARL